MKKLVILIAALTCTGQVYAQGSESPKAGNLQELLQIVKDGRIKESREYKAREATFRRALNQQKSELDKAIRIRVQEEDNAARLEKIANENDKKLQAATEQLSKAKGTLNELFGVLQQVSGDTRGKFDSSIISAQIPGRGEFLQKLAKKMGSATELATIEEMRQVIYELQREMTESGEVVRFNATVTDSNGQKAEKSIVRVGSFNLIADGKYLVYEAETGNINELKRQPAGVYTSSASGLYNAQSGVTSFAVDPSRGSVLSLLVQKQSLFEQIMAGQAGFVGWVIIAVGIFALLLAAWRLLVLSGITRKVKKQIKASAASVDNPLGRVLAVHDKNKGIDTETLELKLHEAMLKETPVLLQGVTLLKIIAVVAPLMGLLGTVTGMIQTFQAITLFGTGDPKIMAGGISQALLTTVLGLFVSIPITLLHSIVNSRSKGVIHVLEEQTAGIIASHNEKH